MIEEQAHIANLTDKVKEMLESKGEEEMGGREQMWSY